LTELRSAALQALQSCSVGERLQRTMRLDEATLACAAEAALVDPGGLPGRPPRPLLVAPAAVAVRSVGTREGRAAMLHALAHIEFNAIGLALDHLWRFAGMPAQYYRDWARVAVEEASHFSLLRARLQDGGHDYGDFPAHDGLWEMARRTADDVLARMALVPRTLEARGLDASPAVRAKFAACGDSASAALIDVILRDEIGHVAIGNHWFRYLCALRHIDPVLYERQAQMRCGAPRPRGPFNIAARLQAGFTAEEVEQLRDAAG
jgi:uncharacterized ferritin-like protein (DUF455 family)